MPSSRTHDAFTWLMMIPFGALCWAGSGDPVATGAGIAAYLGGGFFFNGDLDTQSRPFHRWGLLRWIWFPYQALFRHRSPWTHGIVRGFLVRLFYLSVLLSVAFVVVESRIRLPFPTPNLERKVLLALIAGLWAGASQHSVLDGMVSGWKRIWRFHR